MNQHYTYLFLNLSTAIVPLLASFHPRLAFRSKFLPYLLTTLLCAPIFLIWDSIFSYTGTWSFNEKYITGSKLAYLPLEEILFFILIPFACIIIYVAVSKVLVRKQIRLDKYFLVVSMLSALLAISFVSKLYSFVVFLGCAHYFAYLAKSSSKHLHSNYYLYYIALGFVGFLIVNSILTSLPIVSYSSEAIIGLRIGSIPIEDAFYYLLMNTLYLQVFLKLTEKRV